MGNSGKDIKEALSRYLSTRRSVWGDIAFVVSRGGNDRAGVKVEPGVGVKPETRALETGNEQTGTAMGSQHVTTKIDSGAPAQMKQKPTEEKKSEGVLKEGKESIKERWKGESIRYTSTTKSTEQASLFSEPARAPEEDLSSLNIEELEAKVAKCKKCPLWEQRTNTVFGSGNKKAKLLFVGEAPGREEDLQGLPFVGRAGQLLTKILASVGLSREEVYITNILKCRPPNNRDPKEEEVSACEPYLARQIELIKPVLICALGRVAGQNLLKRNASLTYLRGGIHYYNDIMVVVTYHPAALLRNPNLKRDAWEDIKMIRKLYDEALAEEE